MERDLQNQVNTQQEEFFAKKKEKQAHTAPIFDS